MSDTALHQPGPARSTDGASSPGEDERRQLARVRADLEREFAEQLSAEQVAQRLAETVSAFDGAPIRSFVPVLAQRQARSALREALSDAR